MQVLESKVEESIIHREEEMFEYYFNLRSEAIEREAIDEFGDELFS